MLKGYDKGFEIRIGKNIRIAPFGNRTGHEYGELHHYHRSGLPSPNGGSLTGQGFKRHRPWQSSEEFDQSFEDRF